MPLTPEEKERRRRYRSRRVMVAVHKNLHEGLRVAAFQEGRSISNLVSSVMWHYLQDTHRITVPQGVTDWTWRPKKAEDQTLDALDKELGQ